MNDTNPDDVIEELIDVASRTADRIKAPTDDWLLYIPTEYADAVTDHVDDRRPMDVYHNGTTIGGHEWEFDNYIDGPQLLPASIQDLTPETYCLMDPPEALVREWVELDGISESSSSTPFGDKRSTYTIRPFYNIRRRHHTLNNERIQRYDLDVDRLADTEPDGYQRQKIGHEFTRTAGVPDEIAHDETMVERKIVETIIDIANSIDRSPIFGRRERRIEFPYEILDFTHRERIRCGTTYTYYGGVFLHPVEFHESAGHIDDSIIGETGSIQEGHT